MPTWSKQAADKIDKSGESDRSNEIPVRCTARKSDGGQRERTAEEISHFINNLGIQ
jgi:hypothetical protein